MLSPGPLQLIIVAIIALLLFGNRLPEVMRSLGKSVTEFKKGVNGVEEEVKGTIRDTKSTEESKKESEE